MNVDEYVQHDIAKNWKKLVDEVSHGDEKYITFSEFFFYFTGFNAMYLLYKKIWYVIDNKIIEKLKKKITDKQKLENIKFLINNEGFTEACLRNKLTTLSFKDPEINVILEYTERSNSEREQIKNLLEKFDNISGKICAQIKSSIDYFCKCEPLMDMKRGDDYWGRKNRKILESRNSSDKEKIKAMGQIIYTVRCNLYHGKKVGSENDYETVKNCIKPLRVFLDESINLYKF